MSWVRQIAVRSVAEVALGRQRSPKHNEGPHMVKYLRAANVKNGELDLSDVKMMNFAPEEQLIFSLRSGDVLITEGSGSLSTVGASAIWQGEIDGTVCFQNTLIRLRPRSEVADGRFLAWWAKSSHGSGLFASLAGGANIYHLSAERVRSLRIDFPSIAEQQRIADFLDAEVGRLVRMQGVRRQQIRIMEERRKVAVLSAIRGEAEPGARRDSGVRWLGSVPEAWPVAAVSHQFEAQLGKMLNDQRTRGDRLRPYLRNVNVQWGEIDVSDLLEMDFPEGERRRYEVKPGDLLICEGGEPGRCAIWNGSVQEIYYQKALHRVRARGHSSVEWLSYCMRAATAMNAFAVEGNVATISHLTGEQLRAHRFPFPEKEIQERIVLELNYSLNSDKNLIGLLGSQIELLEERKRALITAAVTGQIDITTARGADVT